MSEYITDPSFDGTLEEIREHYERVRQTLENLATLGDEYPTLGFAGNAGWYVTKDLTDPEAIEAGWSGRARCRTLDQDLSRILSDELGEDDRDREIFNITSWKTPGSVRAWRRYSSGEDGREWEDDEKPTPDKTALRGFGFWCDLDLADKAGRAELTEDELATVERAQARVIESVADLYGVDEDAVYALDSGGGAYVYGPPEVALPIAEEFEPAELELVMQDLGKRLRKEHFGEKLEEDLSEIDGALELLDPDWIQNSNRQSKAPGAIHHGHDLVVTPLRRRDPETGTAASEVSYEPTRVSEFTEEEVASLEAWADGLTSVEHRDAVATFVENLYPQLAAESESWRDLLRSRLSQLQQQERARAERQEAQKEYLDEWSEREGTIDAFDRPEATPDGDVRSNKSSYGAYQGCGVTTDREEQRAALESIDVTDVIREHASDAFDTSTRPHETTFDPSWRQSGSGKSCAIPNGENRFIDNGEDAGGGPVKAYALGEGLIRDAAADLGDVYGETVDKMRADGYNIPVWVPEATHEEYDQAPFWAVKRAAVALGVLEPGEFVSRENDDGDAYEGFPDARAYNETLDALEAEGIEHGRERSEAGQTVYEPPSEFSSTADGTSQELDEDLPATKPDDPAGELIHRDGCYGYRVEREDQDGNLQYTFYQATNFTLETLEFIETDDGEEFRLRVHPAHPREDAYEVNVAPDVFNESRSFKSEVVTGRTTQFEAQRSSTLNELRLTVGAQVAPEREGIGFVGSPTTDLDEFVTPEGVLTGEGWTEDPQYKYYAQTASDSGDASIVGDKWALTAESAEYDTEAVRETLELLPQTRLPGRALATLGWFYSAAAKPLIHDIEGEFNHLQVRGKSESGKTSFLQICTEAFGMEPSPWSASATGFSVEQLHVGSRGAPVWIDEYKPSDMNSRGVDRLHRFLRMATRESIRTKGRPDQTFMKFRLQSPIVLSGEQQISEPAVRRRTIQVALSARATEQADYVEPYSRLTGEPYEDDDGSMEVPSKVDLSQHAMAYYQFLLSRDAEDLRAVWTASRETASNLLAEADLSLRGSELQGAQTVVFGYRLYRRFADMMGVPDAVLPDESDLRAALRHIAEQVGAGGQRQEHTDEFLELLSQAASTGYVMDDTQAEEAEAPPGYRVYRPQSADEDRLALHMPTVYPAVKRYARDYNVESEYNLLARNDYNDAFGDLATAEDTHVAATSYNTRIGGSPKRCLHLAPEATHERLGSAFDLSAFGIVEDESEEDTAGEESQEYLTPADVEVAPDLEDRAKAPPVRGTVGGLWENQYNQPRGELVDEEGSVDLQFTGFDAVGETPLSEGDRVEVSGLRYRNPGDERPYYEFRRTSEVEVLEASEQSSETSAETDGEAIAALECQRAATFTATVASVGDGEYNREAQGTLEDDVGTVLGVVIPGDNENQLEGKQGARCKFENVTIRTDDDGLKEAVVNDASTVARVDGAAQAASERATDGGTTAGGETDDTDVSPRREAAEDVEDAVGQVREYLRLQVDHNEKVSRAKVAGHTGLQPATVGAALERLLEDGTLQRRPDGDLMKTT